MCGEGPGELLLPLIVEAEYDERSSVVVVVVVGRREDDSVEKMGMVFFCFLLVIGIFAFGICFGRGEREEERREERGLELRT